MRIKTHIKNRLFLACLFACLGQFGELYGQCEDFSNYWEESWVSCNVEANPNTARGDNFWLLYEFTEPQAISTTHIWNANRTGESSMGAKEVYVDVSIDGTNWISISEVPFVWPQGTEATDYSGFAGPNLDSLGFIKKVLFTIVSKYDNSACVSVAEVRFDINPLACYGVEDVCGVCDGEGLITYYQDADGDGLGDPNTSVDSCTEPTGYVDNSEDPCDNGLYGWADIKALFEENGCIGCHGDSGASGLNLTTYEGITNGGNNCGTSLLTGDKLVGIITIPGYDGCSSPIGFPSMNERVGGALDSSEIASIQIWVDSGAPYDCNCPSGSPDSDNDGICDASDDCPNFDNNLIGTPCDDGMDCTFNDVYLSSCNCEGQEIPDTDMDGVCDVLDLSPFNPCTADGIVGLPEPSDWMASASNDCDEDGVLFGDGDLDDYNACIDDEGTSLAPDCSCPGSALQAGPKYVQSQGIWGTSAYYAQGLPDGNLTGALSWNDYIDLSFPYMEIGQEICFEFGFGDASTGIKFEINELGSYKLFNPDSTKVNYEIQSFCFPTFVAGEQRIRITRLVTGNVKIDGATYSYCDCTESDPDYYTPRCQCPTDFSEGIPVVTEAVGFNNPQNAEGAPDNVFTGWFNGENDSLIYTFPSLPIQTEICVAIAFDNLSGKIGFDLNGDYFQITNPYGIDDNTVSQEMCFPTTTSGPQTLVIKEEGSGSIFIDGAFYRSCNGCPSDSDNDTVCDYEDICEGFDDLLDVDNDGIPDGCDPCNDNLIGTSCDDGNLCTINDVYDANCNCVGVFEDDDSDGVCNANDVCAGGNDNLDADTDGIPDFCDSCDNNLIGTTCDDGDVCTINDVYDTACNCVGTFADDDGDGVCNTNDVCAGGDDNLDTDTDGIPDFCDSCDNNLIGTSCDDGDVCTINDVYDTDCNCAGIFADDDGDGVCNANDICTGGDDNQDGDTDGVPDYCDSCDNNLTGISCDDGDVCTINDVYDVDCNCVGTFADDDGDGVCNVNDVCAGGDDNLDADSDGIPDFCDSCNNNLIGTSCDDGDVCTINDVYDVDCNCVGTFVDDDGDGVCNANDVCAGGDDNLDSDTDGVPDFCDSCDNNLTGTSCDDGDVCTINDVYDVDCNCVGTFADNDGDGVCNANDICAGGDDNLDSDIDGIPDYCDDCDGAQSPPPPCDDNDPCTINDVFDTNCNCAGTFADEDGDGVCNADDICQGGDDNVDSDNDGIPDFCDSCDNNLTGTSCDDGNVCTINDVYDIDCNCVGTFADEDGDGVCNANDICQGGDDNVDSDNDGIPDFCDSCDNNLTGTSCDDGDVCTINDVYDADCNCVGFFADEDNDGVCDANDICTGGDDNIDSDTDGVPDFCDDCDGAQSPPPPCDDGDPCTINDVYDTYCNCAGTFADDDGDGVCNADDICAGGDDNLDADTDGIPDFCDDCDNNLAGTTCDDGDVCTIDDVYDADCNCAGTFADADGDGVCDADDICTGGDDNLDSDTDGIPDFCDSCDNNLIGTSCDDGDACTIDDVYDADCNCAGIFADVDGDGVCDADDICVGGDDNLDSDTDGIPDFCDSCDNNIIGTSCDDGDVCTVNDTYDSDCNCIGIFEDDDADGICNVEDLCDGGDDNLDADGDGTPDLCDSCFVQFDAFAESDLVHTGLGSTLFSLSLENRRDATFIVSGLDSLVGNNPSQNHIDEVEITYMNHMGITYSYGTFSGSVQDSIEVSIVGPVRKINVALKDGYDGFGPEMSVKLSEVESCFEDRGEESENDLGPNAPQDMTLYPNPTWDEFFVSFNAVEHEVYELTVLDAWGRIFMRREITGMSGKTIVGLSSLNLTGGVYFINLDSNMRKVNTKKLVVVKN